jgi:hypothetical protein
VKLPRDPRLLAAKHSVRLVAFTGWQHQLRVERVSRHILHCEAPPCRGEPLGSIETPTPDSPHPAVHIVEALRDFVTRTPFERQKLDYGALFLFHVN